MAVKEPEVKIEQGTQDEFDKIADVLRGIEESAVVDEEAVLKLSALVEKLSPASRKAFLDTNAAQKLLERMGQADDGEAIPGKYKKFGIFSTKIPWKREDLDKFKKIKFFAEKKYNIIWNGIQFLLEQDVEHEIPEPVYQIILDQRLAEREARQRERYGYEGGVSKLQDGWAGKDNVDKEVVT